MEKGRSTEADILIGQRLRTIRKNLDMTQQDLAKFWNVSFQQVQKYESGTNRLSASKLIAFIKKHNLGLSMFDVEYLDDQSGAFLSQYKKLSHDEKELLMDFVRTLSKKRNKN